VTLTGHRHGILDHERGHRKNEERQMPMQSARIWTLDELHSLPEDGNRYEVIDGELFVTPAPTDLHETIAARLTRVLDPYVEREGLGYVYRPRAVFRVQRRSEVEPDLMVRLPNATAGRSWEDAPIPALIVEILSPYTRRRDQVQKRAFYLRSGVPEYWVIDPDERTVRVVRPDEEDRVESDEVIWHPAGATRPLTVAIAPLFG
jgi:Uma2 family endonuclease